MDCNTETFVSVPVFWVDGPLPACSAVRPPAACILSVKEQPGGEAHSLQTDLDSVWLNPASSCCFLPCRPDGRSFSPTSFPPLLLLAPSFIHLLWLTVNVLFVPRLEKFLTHVFLCLVYLLAQAFLSLSLLAVRLSHHRMKIFVAPCRFPPFSTCIPLSPVCLSVFLSLVRTMKTSQLLPLSLFFKIWHIICCFMSKTQATSWVKKTDFC